MQLLKLKILYKEPIAEYAEERISELEDKTAEITSEEQKKVKRMRRAGDSLKRPRGPNQMYQHSNYRGPRRRKEKERVLEIF